MAHAKIVIYMVIHIQLRILIVKDANTRFYPKDLFILLAKNRLVADWQPKNQKNARKFHSYFWVFQKCSKKIEYV